MPCRSTGVSVRQLAFERDDANDCASLMTVLVDDTTDEEATFRRGLHNAGRLLEARPAALGRVDAACTAVPSVGFEGVAISDRRLALEERSNFLSHRRADKERGGQEDCGSREAERVTAQRAVQTQSD